MTNDTISGRMTSQKICQCEAPSMAPALSSDRGIVSMNCRSRNVPNALKAAGTIRPTYESSIPRCTRIV
jgi:hypothetical protein